MKAYRTVLAALLMLMPFVARAQQSEDVLIDYNNPRKYIVGGVIVDGNHHFPEKDIKQQAALHEGMEITIPGDDITSVVKRLWAQRYFEDVAVGIDHLSEKGDSVYIRITLQAHPRYSSWSFTGVRSGEQKEIQERLSLRRGGPFSEFTSQTSAEIIRRYFVEKGFLNCEVTPQINTDPKIQNAVKINFAVDRGQKVKIKTINFIGNTDVSDFKIAKQMKKTKSAKIYNFFSSKKFNEKEYVNDKRGAIAAFNEAGYRDARLIKDSIYYVSPNRLGIDLTFDQGDKYYFRDISWTGNSVFASEDLGKILNINKGDVYDVVTMDKRLNGGEKEGDYGVSKIYRDNGYLFFDVTPVELNIQNDSVDVELRITEGKQATLNNIIINGNDLTNEKVVRRQIFTRPGNLFSQTDFERSIREIASLGQFDAEAITDPNTGYAILPNPITNTVDIVYNVTEKPSSQLELSGGWGGNTFVGTVGVSFNNFSTHRIGDKSAWRPVPLGDAQNLAFRFQTNGRYYTALSASFTEPWLFGKKPTSLNLTTYFTRQTNAMPYYNVLTWDREMEVFGFSGSIGTRLKWPDNYFVLYNGLSWQTYKMNNWYSGYFIFDDGMSHNFSYSITLNRTSTDQQIFPRSGSEFTASLSLTPPYSIFRKKGFDKDGNVVPVKSWRDIDYNYWSAQDRYRWIEYHKWKFSGTVFTRLVGDGTHDLVLMARAQFGYLGYYNRSLGYSPFEGFLVGGDGMSGYSTYGSEVISLRGYTNYSLTPYLPTQYNSQGYAYAGNVYDKFTTELRFPVILQPQSTIYVHAFLEGGNCWSDIRDFRPFQIKRSAGVGVRIFLPMVGLLGVDWGYGFDDPKNGKSQFHFVIGQQF